MIKVLLFDTNAKGTATQGGISAVSFVAVNGVSFESGATLRLALSRATLVALAAYLLVVQPPLLGLLAELVALRS